MNHILIVNQMDNEVAELVASKFDSVDVVNDFSKLKNNDKLLWLPNSFDVERQVFNLIDTIDAHNLTLNKIVMISIAGINEEISPNRLKLLWGTNFETLILDYQYAVKMIDELEMPYTIVRVPPIVIDETPIEISNEGIPMIGNKIGQLQLSNLLAKVCSTNDYLNSSIGISDK